MPALTLDKFDKGIDRRKARNVSDANKMWSMTNAYVTTGGDIQQRPGLTKVADLESGTVGLVAHRGKLNTFSAGVGAVHANDLFKCNNLFLTRYGVMNDVLKIHDSTVFNGFLYVTAALFSDEIEHVYLEEFPVWEAGMIHHVDDRIMSVDQRFTMICSQAGTTGASEPSWTQWASPPYPDDGSVKWQKYARYISATNNPKMRSIERSAQKIFAVDAENVKYSKTGNPLDWSATDDAGFLPTGLQAQGSTFTTAVGTYKNKLASFADDNVEIWSVDPDPARMSLDDVIPNTGTIHHGSVNNVAGDLFYLAWAGFRTISALTYSDNLSEIDVGSPIDSLVQGIGKDKEPISIYYQAGGQYWCAIDNAIWIYTFSRTAKINAWSRYEYPFDIHAFTELNGILYIRSDDAVHMVDPAANTDDGELFDVDIEMMFLTCKKPGQEKLFVSADAVISGTADLSFRYDAQNPDLETDAIEITGDSRPTGLLPVEVTATEIAPHFHKRNDGPFRLSMLQLYYDVLGLQ